MKRTSFTAASHHDAVFRRFSFGFRSAFGIGRSSLVARAFTLIELLGVIAIIAILASLLLPGLAKAKTKAQGIQCLNNLNQMSLSWIMYADDNADRIPPNNILAADQWRTWVRGWLDNQNPVPDNTNTVYLATSHLWPYHRALGVWRCPADRSVSRHGGRWHPRVRSLSMNNWLNSDAPWEGQRQFKVFRRLSDMTEPGPAKTWVVIDEREDRINNGFFVVDMRGFLPWDPRSLQLVDIPASYHNGAGGLTFADGHSEIKKWLDPRTKPGIRKRANLALFTASPNNVDVRWLQERSTGSVK
jgi:prepilin-type N-terminal cleavage/methylation domain-containing protein